MFNSLRKRGDTQPLPPQNHDDGLRAGSKRVIGHHPDRPRRWRHPDDGGITSLPRLQNHQCHVVQARLHGQPRNERDDTDGLHTTIWGVPVKGGIDHSSGERNEYSPVVLCLRFQLRTTSYDSRCLIHSHK